MHYIVVRDSDRSSLEKRVKQYKKDGWQLSGGIQSGMMGGCFQIILKEPKKKGK